MAILLALGIQSSGQLLNGFLSSEKFIFMVLAVIFLFQSLISDCLILLDQNKCNQIQHTCIKKIHRQTSQNKDKHQGYAQQNPHVVHLRNLQQIQPVHNDHDRVMEEVNSHCVAAHISKRKLDIRQ